MKHIKKLIVAALAVVTAVALCVPAMAFADSILVKNVLDGETYTAYKILNYTANNDKTAVSYYLTAAQYDADNANGLGKTLEAAGFTFTASSDGTQYFVDNADQAKEGAVDVAAAAAFLAGKTDVLDDVAIATATATGEDGEADFDTLAAGYYFVTTTAGSLCALHDEDGIETVVEKNTVPSVDKKEKTTGDDFVDGPVDANIGDTVQYQIVVTDGIGTNAAITLTDTMTAGLTYTAGTIKINGNAVADNANTDNWQVTVDGQTITIVFKAAYVASVEAEETITVTFDATVNKNAVVDDNGANGNTATLEYSEQSSTDTVYVETYDVLLKKTDGTDALEGAEFNVYTTETDGTPLKFSSDNTGYYLDASGAVEIEAGDGKGVNIRGLAPGTYYFEETVAPDGYNKLSERKSVTVATGGTAAVEITVVNEAGAVLPSTGGMGTTILYIVGGIMIVGAGAYLFIRRRASKNEKFDSMM